MIARLDDAQIANARRNDMREVWDHAQLQARQRWTPVDTPAGPVPALLAWAQRVLDAVASAAGAAVAVDGKMVDKPVLLRPQALLRQAAD